MKKRFVALVALLYLVFPVAASATKPCPENVCRKQQELQREKCHDAAEWVAIGTLSDVKHHLGQAPLNKDFAEFTLTVTRREKGVPPSPVLRFRVQWCSTELPADTRGEFRFYGASDPFDGKPVYLDLERLSPYGETSFLEAVPLDSNTCKFTPAAHYYVPRNANNSGEESLCVPPESFDSFVREAEGLKNLKKVILAASCDLPGQTIAINLERLLTAFPQLEELHLGQEILPGVYPNRDNCTLVLEGIPASIGRLNKLKVLAINQFERKPSWGPSVLPDSIGDLSELRRLKLSSIFLRSLPKSIAQLKNLEELDVSLNFLKQLPNEFGSLKRLRDLRLSNTCVQDIPSNLTHSALERVSMGNNYLSLAKQAELRRRFPKVIFDFENTSGGGSVNETEANSFDFTLYGGADGCAGSYGE